MASRACDACGMIYHRSPATLGRFCSHRCHASVSPPPPKLPRLVTTDGSAPPAQARGMRRCERCGSMFELIASTFAVRKFCSRTCAAKAVGEMKRGDRHPNWRGGSQANLRGTRSSFTTRQVKLDSVCKDCGTTTDLHAHHIQRVADRKDLAFDPGNIEILCRVCHAGKHPECGHLILKARTDKVQIECAGCGAPFLRQAGTAPRRERQYCSRACYYADPTRPVRGGQKADIIKACGTCGITFRVQPHRAAGPRFCSRACQMAACQRARRNAA